MVETSPLFHPEVLCQQLQVSAEVKRIRGKKHPLTAAGVQALLGEYTRTIQSARALAAEALHLDRTLSDLVNQACGLTPAEVAPMWQPALPCMPAPRPTV